MDLQTTRCWCWSSYSKDKAGKVFEGSFGNKYDKSMSWLGAATAALQCKQRGKVIDALGLAGHGSLKGLVCPSIRCVQI